MRSIADQTEDELGGTGSVLVRQRRDHVELHGLMERCRAGTLREREEALHRVFRLSFSHAFAEESVLWPAVRARVPDGEALTLRVEQEHQRINELATVLERAEAGSPTWEDALAEVLELLDRDVRDEEDALLPRLQAVLDRRELASLGRRWELVRRTAPTRPHPVVSRRPPGNVLAALPLTLIDRSRDVLDVAGRRLPPSLAGGPAAASRALAVAAGAVERLRPLQRGEDPSTRAGEVAARR